MRTSHRLGYEPDGQCGRSTEDGLVRNLDLMERTLPTRPTAAIVVAARNEERTLGACLDALLAQTYPAEIVVADGVSEDGTRGVAQQRGVRVVDNPGRIAATGFNAGIEATSSDVVGIMSAHAVPALDYVERGIHLLRTTGAWGVGGRIVRTATSPTQRAIALASSSRFGVGDARHNYSETGQWVETAFPGLWPRWVFDEVGLFDPELVRNQDDELSDRIREAGGRIWYDPELKVAYEPRASLRALFEQYRQYAFWKPRVFRKHPGSIRPRHLVPSAWLACLAAGSVGAGTPLRWLLVPSVGLYGLLIGAAGLRLGGRQAPRIAATLVAMHAGYGLGMLQGLIRLR